jgi:hypothetical protein
MKAKSDYCDMDQECNSKFCYNHRCDVYDEKDLYNTIIDRLIMIVAILIVVIAILLSLIKSKEKPPVKYRERTPVRQRKKRS